MEDKNVNYENGYTYDEVATITGAAKTTVINWKKDGRLVTVKDPNNKKIIYVTSNSLIDFLVDKKNRRYFDCACLKSNLLHGNDFNALIERMQVFSVDVIDEPIPAKNPSNKPSHGIIPKYRSSSVEHLKSIMASVDKSIKQIDSSIEDFNSIKKAYNTAKSTLADLENAYTPDDYDKKIALLNSAIRGVNTTIDILKSIRRNYAANISVIKLTIEADEKVNV